MDDNSLESPGGIRIETIFKVIELMGTSSEGYEKAIESAIARAGTTLKGLEFFEVVEHRGHIRGGALVHQVRVKIGFKVEDIHG